MIFPFDHRRKWHFRANIGPRVRFKGSSGTNTVTQESGPPAEVLANYQQVYQQAQNVANTPTQPYNGSLVAGFTPMQQAGFNAINTSANAAQPFDDAASQDMTNAASLLSPSNFGGTVAQYQSPYTQQVVNATEGQLNNQNAIQQNQLAGNAASAGAFGGDRQAVAQAVLAGQQQANEAPTIANLYNTGFQNATSAAQSGAYLDSQAGFGLGQLGTAAQGQGLQTANAELSAGSTQQQLAQQELNVPYESYLAAQSYPYQTTNWLEGMATGTGGASGGTGSTTSPGPSALSQIGGAGIAGLGAYGLLNSSGALSGLSSSASSGLGYGDLSGTFAEHRGGRIERSYGGDVAADGSLGASVPGGSSIPNVDINVINPGNPASEAAGVGTGLLASSAGGTSKTSGGSGLSQPAQDTNAAASSVAGFFGGPLGGLASSLWTKEFPGISPGALTQDTFGSGNVYTADLAGFGGLKRGGRAGYASGGNPTDPMNFGYGVPDLSVTMVPTTGGSARGNSTIPQPPKSAGNSTPSLTQDINDASAMSKLGSSIAPLFQSSNPQSNARGGMVGFGGQRAHGLGGLSDRMRAIPHLDAGGQPSPDLSTPAGLSASVNGNPVSTQLEQSYSGLPTNKLQQMATNLPANTPQGQMVQRALQQRMIHPQTDPSQPSVATPQAGMGAVQGYADGGTPDLPDWAIHDQPYVAPPDTPSPDAPVGEAAPDLPDSVAQALQRHADDGSTPNAAPVRSGRAGDFLQGGVDPSVSTPPTIPAPQLDTTTQTQGSVGGFGPAPQQQPDRQKSYTDGPWQAILAAGLGMMSGTSKFPLVNIGQGGLEGLKTLQSMPKQRTEQIQSEQAQDNLDALRAMRSGIGIGGGSPAGAGAPSVGGMAPVSGGQGGVSAVGQDGTPLFNLSNEYANAQRMMMSGVPAYVDAGKAKLSFLETVLKNGVVPTSTGGVVPLSGSAEAAAQRAGLIAGAEAPTKVATAYAERAGTPLRLAPGETAVSGASILPPSAQGLIDSVTGAGRSQASPYAQKTMQDEAGLNPSATNGSHVGAGGFDPPTWLSTIKSAYPQQTQGMSDQQLLALRTNPQLSMQMTDRLAQTNAPILQQAGLPVNQSSARLAHWFGPQGAISLANAPANTPIESLFSPAVVQQNGLTGKSAGDVVRGVVQRYGTAPLTGATTQPQQQPSGASAPTLQPTAASVPSMINATQFPPDLPPSQSMAAPHNVRNADGSLTNSVSFAQRATQEAAGKFIGTAPAEINKLNDTQLLLNGLHSEVTTNAASPGWYQSGAGAEWRTDIAKAVNGTVTAVGGKAPFDQAAIGNVEEFNKNSSVAAFSLARSMAGGRVALGEVTQANRSVPNMGNTPYGNVMVTHLLMQQNARESDRLKYQAAQAANGVDPNVAFEAFNQQNPPSKYVAAASAGSVSEAFPQVVQALKGAPSATNIAAFDRRYGEGAAEVLLQRP